MRLYAKNGIKKKENLTRLSRLNCFYKVCCTCSIKLFHLLCNINVNKLKININNSKNPTLVHLHETKFKDIRHDITVWQTDIKLKLRETVDNRTCIYKDNK